MILRTVTVVRNNDGSIRSIRGEYVEIDTNGADRPIGTQRIAAADLATVLPDTASLLASIDALTAERDALQTERDQLAAAQPPAPVEPSSPTVTAYQARAALYAAGLLDAVNAAVEAANGQVQIAWEYSTTISRDSQFIAAMKDAIPLTDQEIDDLFVAAAAVQ